MRIYFLDDPLSNDDLGFVQESLGIAEPIEQVRIPYVLPALSGGALTKQEHETHEAMLRKRLRKVDVGRDRGKQIVLVTPKQLYWYAVLANAFFEETGKYPYFVQTEEQRHAIGNPGPTRLLDGHGLMGFKD